MALCGVRAALLAWRSLDGFLALRAHVAGHARARFGRAALSSNVSAFISLHGTFFFVFRPCALSFSLGVCPFALSI
jgi:hypothetical protein